MEVLLGVIFLSLGVRAEIRRSRRTLVWHAHPVQELGGGLLGLPEEPQQEVAALDAFRTELAGFVAGEEHHPSGFFCEFFEHGSPLGVRLAPRPGKGSGVRQIQG